MSIFQQLAIFATSYAYVPAEKFLAANWSAGVGKCAAHHIITITSLTYHVTNDKMKTTSTQGRAQDKRLLSPEPNRHDDISRSAGAFARLGSG